MGTLHRIILVLCSFAGTALSADAEVWGPCVLQAGDCGAGKETSNKFIIGNGSKIVHRTRICHVTCPEVGLLLRRSYFMSETDNSEDECPADNPKVGCAVNPCDIVKCTNYPFALCKPNYCGACKAVFYNDNAEVVDHCEGPCGYGQEHNECGSACIRTCSDPLLCATQCIPRCECPPSAPIFHNQSCISLEECPRVCPDEEKCLMDPCSTCPGHPGAECRRGDCGGCDAVFYDESGNVVTDCTGDSTDAPYATIASGIVGDEEPPNLESESHETTVPEVVEEPAVPEVVEEPAVPEVVEEPAVVEVVEEPGVPEVVEEPAVPEVDADSTEVASNIAEVVTDETNSSKDNDTTIEFDTFQIEGDNEMDNITWAALNKTEISIADNSETRTLSLDEDDSFCTGNVTTVVYTKCNVTCGEGIEVVWLLVGDVPCGSRSQPCYRKNCTTDDEPATLVHLEKMTDCEGHCKPGETTSQGFIKYIKLSGTSPGVPFGISKEMCTLVCPPPDLPKDGKWSECSARCKLGTQSRIEEDGTEVSRACNGTNCEVIEDVFHLDEEDDGDWSTCQVVANCEVGVQFRPCRSCSSNNEMRLCSDDQCTGESSNNVAWSDWTQCKCSENADVVSTRRQINCATSSSLACKEETRTCECSYNIHKQQDIHKVGLVGGETDYTLQVGAALELTCFVVLQSDDDVSDVDVNIEWLTIDAGDGIDITSSSEVLVKEVNGVQIIYNRLTVPSLTKAHSATYMCKVLANNQTRLQVSTVNVLHFLSELSDVSVSEEGTVSLVCEVSDPKIANKRFTGQLSAPPPDALLTRTTMLPTATSLPEKERVYMTWKKNGVTLFPLVYSRPPYRSVLTIFKAEEQDEGGYQCHVRYGDLRLESRVSHVTLEQEVDLQVRSYDPVMSHKYEAAYWSEWTTCSSQCQIGFTIRGRQLYDSVTENEVRKCSVDSNECSGKSGGMLLGVEYNGESHHMSVFSDWSSWGPCDTNSCLRTRTRECLSAGCDATISTLEPGSCETCDSDAILPNVMKRSAPQQMGRFSRCSTSCGFGVTVRPSLCNDCDNKIIFEIDSCMNDLVCEGSNYDVQTDVTIFAGPDSDEVLSSWGVWSQCDCESNTRSRTRSVITATCIGDEDCDSFSMGSLEESNPCVCEDTFTAWSDWGGCIPACGNGRKYRTRSCSVETPYLCVGVLSDSAKCKNDCGELGDEFFSTWSSWSSCSSAQKYKIRTRDCLDETYCLKTTRRTQAVEACREDEIDNKTDDELYMEWGTWSSCENQKIRHRIRACKEGEDCLTVELMDMEECEKDEKDIKTDDELYMEWGTWSSCENQKIRHRARACKEGKDCLTVELMDMEECEKDDIAGDLVEEDLYMEWGNWSSCEGQDYRHRARMCKEGENCLTVDLMGMEECEQDEKDIKTDDELFTDWGTWSSCENQKIRHRTRACEEGEHCLTVDLIDMEECGNGVITDLYTEWGNWSSCDENQQFRDRTRSCELGYECTSEPLIEVYHCPSYEDVLLGRWVSQGPCEVGPQQCGQGTQMQVRQCQLDTPNSCPLESGKAKECDESKFFECTKIYRIVQCNIKCVKEYETKEPAEWTREGGCVMQNPNRRCGNGKTFEIRTDYAEGRRSKEDLGCGDDTEVLHCIEIVRLAECHIPCATGDRGWQTVVQDCDHKSCSKAVDLTTQYIEMKYKSTESFFGAIGFFGEDGNIGYLAWGFNGFYINTCGRMYRFSSATISPKIQQGTMVWTLVISDQDILLLAEDVLYFREKIDTCLNPYQASKIVSVGFRNFKAADAEYNFVDKGRVGEWVDVGSCMMGAECGTGLQVQQRDCLEQGSCPKFTSFLDGCQAGNFFECAGLFSTRVCSVECSGDDISGIFIGKRADDVERSPGKLVEYESGGCYLPYGKTCGEGEMVMVYSCYYDNSCPLEYYQLATGCNTELDGFFNCSRLFHIIPCHHPCSEEQEGLGEWEDVGKCVTNGVSECSQLQMRSCVNTKTCKASSLDVNCSNPMSCSEFYRIAPCSGPCEDQLGEWVDMHEWCVPNLGLCGLGNQTQTRSCHTLQTCPKWASSSLSSTGDLTERSPLFRSVECEVACPPVEQWTEISECLVDPSTQTSTGQCNGYKIMNHVCVEEGNCEEEFGCNPTSQFSCPAAMKAEPCSASCGLGFLINYGGCLVENEEYCGTGEKFHVYSCYFDDSCPGDLSRANCDPFVKCPALYTVNDCYVSCEEEDLGEWVPNGQCHQVELPIGVDTCGPEAGLQVRVRECVLTETCPPKVVLGMQNKCDGIMDIGCSDLVSLESCEITCNQEQQQESYEANDSSLGTWLKTHECIPDEECGLGSIHQMRSCMITKDCPKWAMEDPSCSHYFNCPLLFQKEPCFVVCADVAIAEVETPDVETADTETAEVETEDLEVTDVKTPDLEIADEETADVGIAENIIMPEAADQNNTTTSDSSQKLLRLRLLRRKPKSCEQLLEVSTNLPSDVYQLFRGNGDRYSAYCKMVERNSEPTAWTLLSSFVNTDGAVSWGKGNLANWRNNSTFGSPEDAQNSDYKGAAWTEVKGTEIMIEDRFGLMKFYLGSQYTMMELLSNNSACSTVPFKGPGNNVDSTSKPWHTHGALLIYPEKSLGTGCASDGNSGLTDKIPVIGFGGTKCGLMGAGMANSYSDSNLDWHMSMNADTTCTTVRCDGARCSGPWNVHVLATSTDTVNKAGVHDQSTWGKLYIR